MFIVWALALVWAIARPVARGWAELSCLAAAAYLFLPVLNALTTERHLGVTLPDAYGRGDWRLAGFDLTMLAIGLLFAAIVPALARKARRASPGIRTIFRAVEKAEPAE